MKFLDEPVFLKWAPVVHVLGKIFQLFPIEPQAKQKQSFNITHLIYMQTKMTECKLPEICEFHMFGQRVQYHYIYIYMFMICPWKLNVIPPNIPCLLVGSFCVMITKSSFCFCEFTMCIGFVPLCIPIVWLLNPIFKKFMVTCFLIKLIIYVFWLRKTLQLDKSMFFLVTLQ